LFFTAQVQRNWTAIEFESDADLLDQKVAAIRGQVEILEYWEWNRDAMRIY
jgi:hypothetical protein